MSTDYTATVYKIAQAINNLPTHLPHLDPTKVLTNLHEEPSFKNTIRQALIRTSPEIEHSYRVHDDNTNLNTTPLGVLASKSDQETSTKAVTAIEAVIREAFLDEAWAHGLDLWD